MTFRIASVARSIDPNASVGMTTLIRGWFNAGLLHLVTEPGEGVEADEPSSRAGSASRVSRHTAIRISAMVALVRLGLSPSDAADVAGSFSHFGTPDLTGGPPRAPGALFDGVETSLIVWRAADGALRRKVLNHDKDAGLGLIRSRLGNGAPVSGPIVILDCAAVLRALDSLFDLAG